MAKLVSKLKEAQEKVNESLWEGPNGGGPNGGVTQSMLNNFLVCRERFRIRYVLGLQPQDTFNHRLEYGSMWHACEESLAAGETDPWAKLDMLTVQLCQRYPLQKSDIIHWYNICKIQFPVYRQYWAKHKDVKDRIPLLQEHTFDVPYELPSSRVVRLRGKWDAIDLINGKVWLQENKTKGDIDPVLMQRQLLFDLQTGFYLNALSEFDVAAVTEEKELLVDLRNGAIGGVRFNVIRRPLSGGKGSIRQKKNQTEEEFYKELAALMAGATGPEWGVAPDEHFFFMRWKVDFTSNDILRFRKQFLNPILEQLCDWWEVIVRDDGEDPDGIWNSMYHFRMPYGIYSPVFEGRPTDVDKYLETGSTVGLHRAEKLFKELD